MKGRGGIRTREAVHSLGVHLHASLREQALPVCSVHGRGEGSGDEKKDPSRPEALPVTMR